MSFHHRIESGDRKRLLGPCWPCKARRVWLEAHPWRCWLCLGGGCHYRGCISIVVLLRECFDRDKFVVDEEYLICHGSWGDLHDHLLAAEERVSDELARTQSYCGVCHGVVCRDGGCRESRRCKMVVLNLQRPTSAFLARLFFHTQIFEEGAGLGRNMRLRHELGMVLRFTFESRSSITFKRGSVSATRFPSNGSYTFPRCNHSAREVLLPVPPASLGIGLPTSRTSEK